MLSVDNELINLRKETELLKKENESTKQRIQDLEMLLKKTIDLEEQTKINRIGLSELRKQVNGINETSGRIAEEQVFEAFNKSKTFGGLHFNDVDPNFGRIKRLEDGTRIQGQYDVVLINDNTVVIIEVKIRARKDDISDLIDKKLKNFKILFSDYADYRFMLGLAADTFDKSVIDLAIKNGIAIIKPDGKNLQIFDENLKIF